MHEEGSTSRGGDGNDMSVVCISAVDDENQKKRTLKRRELVATEMMDTVAVTTRNDIASW